MKKFKMAKDWLIISGLLLLLTATGLFSWKVFFSNEEEVIYVNLEDVDLDAIPTIMNFHVQRPMIMIEGEDVVGLGREERASLIRSLVELAGQRVITANYENREITTTLANLGIQLDRELEEILDDIEAMESKLEEKSGFGLRAPFIHTVDLTHCDESVTLWVQSVAGQLNVAPVEPSLRKVSRGNFATTEGRTGKRVDQTQLKEGVIATLQQLDEPTLGVDVSMEITHPTRDASALSTVDTMIARAYSPFDPSATGRATNVARGAQLVTSSLMMPGEKFSFNELVDPVIPANGFKYGTVFMHGQVDQGIGGGLCQVSSTIYWAQLRAGILPYRRRAHSRPVFYVPRGLDATMFVGQIEYQFINTLDFPLYLNLYTQGGQLTVEFWSNSNALNGKRFEPRSTRVATTATNKTYDAFLRTYNATTNQFISEKWLHRDTYRTD